jgi:putative sterol carrier protein
MTATMAFQYPSEEWMEEYRSRLNENETYAEKGAGWGVDFNGDFIFHLQADGDLPEDRYFFVGLEDGKCTEVREIDDPESVDYGFIMRGAYGDWKKLNEGEMGAIDGMMSGRFDLEGDMQKVMQYSEAAVAMTETSTTIDTEYAH